MQSNIFLSNQVSFFQIVKENIPQMQIQKFKEKLAGGWMFCWRVFGIKKARTNPDHSVYVRN